MKKCQNCGYELLDEAVFCTGCGVKFEVGIASNAGVVEQAGTTEPAEKAEQADNSAKTKKTNKLVIPFVAALVAAIVIGGVGYKSYSDKLTKYRSALASIDDGNVTEGIEILSELGNFKDSASRVEGVEADYQNAKKLVDENKGEEAVDILVKLGDYKDSTDIIVNAVKSISESGDFTALDTAMASCNDTLIKKILDGLMDKGEFGAVVHILGTLKDMGPYADTISVLKHELMNYIEDFMTEGTSSMEDYNAYLKAAGSEILLFALSGDSSFTPDDNNSQLLALVKKGEQMNDTMLEVDNIFGTTDNLKAIDEDLYNSYTAYHDAIAFISDHLSQKNVLMSECYMAFGSNGTKDYEKYLSSCADYLGKLPDAVNALK